MVTSQLFSRILAAEIDGRTQNIRYRQTQFHRLQSALVQHVDEIHDAICADSNHAPEEVDTEIALALDDLRTHYLSLDFDADLEREYRIAHGKDNADAKRGAGIVYIVPTTHTMFYSVICALGAAIAAGNCVIIELAQTTMAVPSVLRRLLTDALDADTFAVSEERPGDAFWSRVLLVTQQDVQTKATVVRQLNSPANARTVAVVDRTANIAEAAHALALARFGFGGHSPYAPDLILVHEFMMKPFVEALLQQASTHCAGQNGEARQVGAVTRRSPPSSSALDLARKDRSVHVLISGSDWGVVEVQDRRSAFLQKKIQEKLLLVHPISSLDDAINISNSTGTLAATYAFAAPSSAKYLTQFVDAYVCWVNHVPTEMLLGPAIPVNEPASLSSTRYSSSFFQVPRPQIRSETAKTALANTLLSANSREKARAAWNTILRPLPSTNQPPGGNIGFFEQGILTGVITGGVFTFLSLGTIGYYTFSLVWRRM